MAAGPDITLSPFLLAPLENHPPRPQPSQKMNALRGRAIEGSWAKFENDQTLLQYARTLPRTLPVRAGPILPDVLTQLYPRRVRWIVALW